MAWTPGGRARARELEAPYPDVPDHLKPHLFLWIRQCFDQGYEFDYGRLGEVAIHMRIQILQNDPLKFLAARCSESDEFMLDLTESILELYGWDRGRAGALQSLLESSNSAYRVKNGWDGLEMLITPEVKEQVQEVVNAAKSSAGDHLREAWNEAYGRKPDPVKSYSESIKAVESALAPIVSPQNGKQTLGTMIRDVKAKPSKWGFDIPDGNVGGVETVLSMMQLLWEGQSSRHGGLNPTPAETVEEARSAVHLAASLVQFATGKHLRQA